jgi:hypothetical protein
MLRSYIKKALLFLIPLLFFYSCLNYTPCEGQKYLIENITHQELINKFNDFRKNHPEYYAGKDYTSEALPFLYNIDLNWKDLNLTIVCEIHTSDKIPNPPTHLRLLYIKNSKGQKLINSKELDEKLSEKYKDKFESEILDKIDVVWKRETCW